jgi:hypothetical protein
MANDERQPPGRQRVVWIALGVAVVIALATGFAVTTVLDVSDTLPGDIFTTLTRDEPPRDSGQLLIVDGPPTGVARGIQLALLGLLLVGCLRPCCRPPWWHSAASQGSPGPASGQMCFSPGSYSN